MAGEILANVILKGDRDFRKSVDSMGDEMEETSGSASIFGSSLSFVAEQITDVIMPSRRAASSMDNLADETSDAGRAAGIAAGSFATLRLSTSGLAAGLTILSPSLFSVAAGLTAVTVAAAPLLAVFSALAVGAAGIVAGFAAIIGSGLIAWNSKLTKQNKKRLKQVREKIRKLEQIEEKTGDLTKAQAKRLRQLEKKEQKLEKATKGMGALAAKLKEVGAQIAPLIVQFGSKFIPLLKDAVNALPALVKSILQAIGPLDKFKQALRDLGQFAMVAIPKVIGFVMDLGRWAIPIFRDIATVVVSVVVPALRDFVLAGKELTPTFSKLAQRAADLLGELKPLVGMLFDVSKEAWQLAAALTASGGLSRALDAVISRVDDLRTKFNKIVPDFLEIESSVRELGRAIGKVLLPVLGASGLVGVLSTLGPSLAPLVGAFSLLLSPLTKIGSVLATSVLPGLGSLALTIGGGLLSAVSTLGSTLIGVAGAFTSISGAISALLGPIGILVGAIVGLYIAWRKNLFNIRKIGKKVFGTITALITGDFDTAAKRFQKATRLMEKSWAKNIKPLLGSAKKVFGKIRRTIAGALNWLMNQAIRPILNNLTQTWDRHMGHIEEDTRQLRDFIKRILDGIKKAIGAFVVVATRLWDKFGDEILTLTKFYFDLMGGVINTILDGIMTAIDIATDIMVGDWKGAGKALEGFTHRVFSGMLNFIDKWGDKLVKFIKGAAKDAKRKFTTIAGNLTDAAVDEAKALLKGVMNWLDKLPGRLVAAAKDAKKSFLRVMRKLVSATIDQAKLLVDLVVFWIGALPDKISDVARDAKKKFANELSEAISVAANVAEKIVDALIRALKSIIDEARQAGAAIIGAFIDGLKSKADDVIDTVEGIVDGISKRLPGSDAEKGPLSNLTAQAQALPETLAKGMLSRIGVVKRASNRLAAAASVGLNGHVGLGVSSGFAGVSGVAAGGGSGEQEVHVTLSVEGDSPLADEIARHVEANEQQKIDGANRGMIDRTDYLG